MLLLLLLLLSLGPLGSCITCALDELGTSKKFYDKKFHFNFNECCCHDEFTLINNPVKTGRADYVDAGLLLQHLLSCCPLLAERFVKALKDHPSSPDNPWDCALGFDEYNCGDKLSSFQMGKKTMAVYFSFAQLESIASNSAWFILCALRTVLINSFQGGWSKVFTQMLIRTFYGAHGLSTVGVPFSHRGEDFIFFAKPSNILSDGEGLKQVTGWRGAGSLRPALLHSNILKKDSDLAHRVPGFVEMSCTDPLLVKGTTSSEFRDRCDLVAAAHQRYSANRITKTMFVNICKSEGQNYIEGGLGFDSRIRNLGLDWFATITVGWVHTFLQDGVFTCEAWLIIDCMGIPGETLKTYLKPWQFPAALQSKGQALWRAFDECRLDDDGSVDKLRCSASECLGLFSLMRYYFERKMSTRADLQANWDSFNSCCDLLSFILAVRNKEFRPCDAAPTLEQKIATYLRFHVACYGDSHLKPKHVWLWALVLHWRRDKHVYDAFIIERLHLICKAIATRCDNTSSFEKSVLSGVINDIIFGLHNMAGPCSFVGKTWKVLDNTMCGTCMNVWGATFTVGDIIVHGGIPCELLSCILEGGRYYGVVEFFQLIRTYTSYGKKWRSSGHVKIVPAAEMLLAIMGEGGRGVGKVGFKQAANRTQHVHGGAYSAT